MAYDIAIKGGLVVDGSGAPAIRADLGIAGDRIARIGELSEPAERTIEADGLVVTPGFVDIHTHLDAQVMWDPIASPTCWHGVTSLVLGNCGMTLAPSRPEERAYLIKLMESVEDIPADSIIEGSRFEGESFGDYLEMLDTLPKGMNVGGLIGHCAMRYYVMGDQGLEEAPASEADVEQLCGLVDEALSDGALGFSTSRTLLHRTPDGRRIPGTFATAEEMRAIGRVLGRRGRGVFMAMPRVESADPEMHLSELEWMTELALETGRPVTFGLLQSRDLPDVHRLVLDQVAKAVARGAQLWPQTQVRSVGLVTGLANLSPFDESPAWLALRGRSIEEKLEALRDPEQRAKLIAGGDACSSEERMAQYFLLSRPDARYDFSPEQSLWGIAKQRGVTPAAAFVDIELEQRGEAYFVFPFFNFDMDVVGEMLADPRMLIGLADSGAHCGQICDQSFSTYFLHYWVQEKKRFSLEEGIRKLSSEPAEVFGLVDRGVLREGAYADINVIDLDALQVPPPEFVHDLPAGAPRYIQRGLGYRYTLVNGEVFMEGQRHTGALAGRVLRSN